MPLADKLRPKKIEDMVGQRHIIGKGKVLNKIIENKSIPNMILYGPPGTGKTTFLKRICKDCPKRVVVTAPTGVAAINANGVTLHSLFQLPFAPYIPGTPFSKFETMFSPIYSPGM